MKKYLLILFCVAFFVQCRQAEKKAAEAKATYVVAEELQRYALSPLDSVWSVKVALLSQDTAVVQYRVNLTYQERSFRDSIVFSLFPGEEANGQIIFPDCITKHQPKPTFTSNLTRLE
jgi:hypothetical protein